MAEDPADDMFRDDGKGEKPVGQARGKGGVLAALSSTAFLEGQQAFGKGKNQTDNPYEREDPLRAEWDSGFTQAKEEFEE